MSRENLEERLITAWMQLTGTLKNSRIPRGMNYNEAYVMNIAYRAYLEDQNKLVSFKEIVSETKMLKSLVNRTINSLVQKGFIERKEGADKRTTFIRLVEEKLSDFLCVHEHSLLIARSVIDTIGEEDARTFVSLSERIVLNNPLDEKE